LIDTSGADLFLRVAVSQSDLERRLLGLADVVALGRDESRVVIKREGQALPDVVARRLTKVVDLLTAAGFEILSIETQKQSLERLFLELTGRKLRD
jgi:hypothetical protein